MGWAKYYEDNTEIMHERKTAMQYCIPKTEIRVACTGFFSSANVIVEIKEEPIVLQKAEYTDRYIICKDCGRQFLFSARSQKYFHAMDWSDPKRCKCCRSKHNTRYLMRSSF